VPPKLTIAARKVEQRLALSTCVDLFSGAGGLSLAARRAGLQVIAAVERCPKACATYRLNLLAGNPGTSLYEGDILTIDPATLASDHFSGDGECDLVLGGPPCQGFSAHRLNDTGVGDPRNKLILRYFEYVRTLRPKAFLMENVPGILWHRHRPFLDAFYAEAARAGYKVLQPQTIDARDYGVPQRRRRVFILGLRRDIQLAEDWPPSPTHAAPDVARSVGLEPWVVARTVFSKPTVTPDPNDTHMQHSDALVRVFAATPKNGGSRRDSGRVLPCHRDHNGHSDVYGRIDPDQPGPTMTTACINPSKGRFVHPTKNHGITLRQAARFQTFPDYFVFTGGLMAAGAQIGNAVPVLLGERLIGALANGLRAVDATRAPLRGLGDSRRQFPDQRFKSG
jgi:DNA (cytosine-5)-methyltransferase 1